MHKNQHLSFSTSAYFVRFWRFKIFFQNVGALICVFPLSPSVYFLRQKPEIRERWIKPFAIEPQAFNFLLATPLPQGKMVWYNKHKILILNWTFQNQIYIHIYVCVCVYIYIYISNKRVKRTTPIVYIIDE